MAKMKAALMYGPNDVRIEQIDKPECPEDGILLNITAIGLCGSDIRNLTTDSRKGEYPWLYGHEHSGLIAEIGSNVKQSFKDKFDVGDRVFVSPFGPPPGSTGLDGGFSEYRAISGWAMERANILPIPDDFKIEYSIMAEPLSSVYACQESVDVKIGQSVAIIGAGPIGCLHSELAKMRGASKVIMIEIEDERLEMSKQFGVDYTINATEVDPIQAVKDLTDGKGADQVISANPSAKAQQQAIYMAAPTENMGRPGGTISLFGGIPKGTLVELDTNHIHYSGLLVYGPFGFALSDNRSAFNLIVSGQFDAAKYVSKIMPMDEINEAIKLAKAGKVIKIVFNP